ncbi:MAG: ATP synthase F1 subunit delta [Candidatus Omnitrophica bacterium]|nr:ATP synthase F1 subunit delta [Candidatus Omnitrophota bacterium]MDD5653337.1 ATP synthase F1 subunit delta [Candidatus Omnitrophota bacterium]
MSKRIAVKRYSEGFVAYAKETVGLERILADLKNLKSVLRDNSEFLQFLRNPEITHLEKLETIDKVLNQDFSKETGFFLKLLLEKERIELINDIVEYIRINYAYQGETEALLKTSFPLDLELVERIEKSLEKKFQRKFKFFIDLDARLLGGVQVTMGNRIIDGSVKRRLEELREQLNSIRIY